MEVRAHLRHLRIAPRKVRLVIDLVRGLPVDRAVEQLSILPKAAATPVRKLIDSAVANAKHNFQLDPQHLVIKSIVANEGPKLKRFRPRAFGRAAEILKRSTHITVVLEDRPKTTAPTKAAGSAVTPSAPIARDQIKNGPTAPRIRTSKTRRAKRPADSQAKQRSAADQTVARKGQE